MIHYYAKFILLVFSLFVGVGVNAQSQQIRPFENYSTCLTGFRNQNGDTIFPAQFETMQGVFLANYSKNQRASKEEKGWIVSADGKYGCILQTGEWKQPLVYTSLEFDPQSGQFIAQRDGKFGTIDLEGNIVLPFAFEQIRLEMAYSSGGGFFVRKDGLLGLYSNSGKVIVPTNYHTITRLSLWGNESRDLFQVSRNAKYGLVDHEGKERIAPKYAAINPFQYEMRSEWNNLFIIEDDNGRFSVGDESGKLLTDFQRLGIEPAYTMRSVKEDGKVRFALRQDSLMRKQLINLDNGRKSEWYDDLNFIGGKVFVQHSGNWMVLDSVFQVIYRNTQPTDELMYFSYDNQLDEAYRFPNQHETEELLIYDRILEQRFGVSSVPQVFGIKRTIRATKREEKNGIYDREYYGLIHLETGKSSPMIYEQIYRFGNSKGVYYWAFVTVPDYSHKEFTVDVYDSTGVYLRTSCLNAFEKDELEELMSGGGSSYDQEYGYYSFPLRTYEHYKETWSVWSFDGKQLVPSILKSPSYLISQQNDSMGVLVYQNGGGGMSFSDFKGNDLLNGRAFDFDPETRSAALKMDDIFMLKRGAYKTLVTNTFELLMDSCSVINQPKLMPGVIAKKVSSFLVIKNKILYVYSDGRFLKMDNSFFHAPTALNQVTSDFFVDLEGNLVNPNPPKPKSEQIGKLILTLGNGSLLVTDSKKKEIQRIPNVSYYIKRNRAIFVKTQDLKEGLLDLQTGLWLVQPKYAYVLPVSFGKTDAFWVRDDASVSQWKIIDRNDKQLTPVIFDETISVVQGSWFCFQSGGKFGTMSTTFDIITEPVFDRTFVVNGKDLFTNFNKSCLLDIKTGKVFEYPYQLSSTSFPKGHLCLSKDYLCILAKDGTEILPPTKISDAIANLNLNKLLYLDSKIPEPLPHAYFEHIVFEEDDSLLRVLNNRIVIENAQRYLLNPNQLRDKRIPIEHTRYPDCYEEALWVSNYVYSERVRGTCYPQPMNGKYQQSWSYRNYRITETGLVPFQFEDLFIAGSDYMQRLDAMIEKQIQERQLFGAVCLDIPGAVSEFKRNFFFGNGNLVLHHYPNDKTVQIPLSALKDVLAFPVE